MGQRVVWSPSVTANAMLYKTSLMCMCTLQTCKYKPHAIGVVHTLHVHMHMPCIAVGGQNHLEKVSLSTSGVLTSPKTAGWTANVPLTCSSPHSSGHC